MDLQDDTNSAMNRDKADDQQVLLPEEKHQLEKTEEEMKRDSAMALVNAPPLQDIWESQREKPPPVEGGVADDTSTRTEPRGSRPASAPPW